MVESPYLFSPPFSILPSFPSLLHPPPSPRCSLLPASLSCSLLQRLARDHHLHTSTSLTVDLAQVHYNGLCCCVTINILLLLLLKLLLLLLVPLLLLSLLLQVQDPRTKPALQFLFDKRRITQLTVTSSKPSASSLLARLVVWCCPIADNILQLDIQTAVTERDLGPLQVQHILFSPSPPP